MFSNRVVKRDNTLGERVDEAKRRRYKSQQNKNFVDFGASVYHHIKEPELMSTISNAPTILKDFLS